jgi:hypothetical protein
MAPPGSHTCLKGSYTPQQKDLYFPAAETDGQKPRKDKCKYEYKREEIQILKEAQLRGVTGRREGRTGGTRQIFLK